MTRAQIEAEIAELKAKNEAATGWGAAVGARSERIEGLEQALRAMAPDQSSAESCDLQTILEVRDFLQDISTGADVTDASRDSATEFVALLDAEYAEKWESCGAESNRHSGAVGAEKRAEQSNPGGDHEVTESTTMKHMDVEKPLPDEPTPAAGGLMNALAQYAQVTDDEAGREELITDLRREKLRLHDALKNVMGVYDTPLSRRRFPPDEFMKDALQSGRAALASQPSPAATVETGCICQDQHRRGYCTEPGCPNSLHRCSAASERPFFECPGCGKDIAETEQPHAANCPRVPVEPQTASVKAIEDAIRGHFASIGTSSVVSSDGIERVYYSGFSLRKLAEAVSSSVTRPLSKCDGADDLEHLDGMLDDRERG